MSGTRDPTKVDWLDQAGVRTPRAERSHLLDRLNEDALALLSKARGALDDVLIDLGKAEVDRDAALEEAAHLRGELTRLRTT